MIDNKEERKYSKLRKLGQELHIPVPEHFIECEVFDKNGKRIQHLKQRSHSWVRNAYNLLLSEMACINIDAGVGDFGPGFLSVKDYVGTVKRGDFGVCIRSGLGSFEGAGGGYNSAAANDDFGILVGSDNTAESFEDYIVITKIVEGIGAGQLNYAATTVPTKSYNGGTLTWTITWFRYFNNNSPGNVNVNEVGLYTSGYATAASIYLNSRDVLGATVTIPATGQLKVTYTFQLVYPA